MLVSAFNDSKKITKKRVKELVSPEQFIDITLSTEYILAKNFLKKLNLNLDQYFKLQVFEND